jgi:protease-4
MAMFSRRHPYLFFFLILTGMLSVVSVSLVIIISMWSNKPANYSGEKVGVVEINGTIIDSRLVIEQIKNFREQDAIKAIVLRINSPGGAVAPSQEIYQEVMRTRDFKRIIVSMGSVAASGGYYIAAGADGIVANPGTITGSIGVIMGYTNFEKILEKIGLTPVVIKSGPYKDVGSPARTMTEEEQDLLQEVVGKIHHQFVIAIAEGRKLEASQVELIADGRIFTGEQAKELGLVDRMGNLEDALKWAGELGGIEGEVEPVFAEDEDLSFIRYIIESYVTKITQSILDSNFRFQYYYQPN